MTISTSEAAGDPTLVAVEQLTVRFGDAPPVVDSVSFQVGRAEIVALVGESGSGKSTTIGALLGLLPSNARVGGSIQVAGTQIVGAGERTLRGVRGAVMAFVPQDPMSNLDPVLRVGGQVAEAARAHTRLGRTEAHGRSVAAMERAGLENASERYRQFPHQYSGGMRQRALIAMGMINTPLLLVADEPTSALDVTVQRRILDNLGELVEDTGTAVLLVTHDLGLAAERADRVIVMRNGRVVETGPALDVLQAPHAEYTQRLVAAAPILSEPATHAAADANAPVILSVEHVTKTYPARGGGRRRGTAFDAVSDVSLEVRRGRTLAVVGESGSGKTTTAQLALRLVEPTSGRVRFEGTDTAELRGSALREFRRRVQPIFQDPYGSLDPMFSVARILEEPLVVFREGDARSRRLRVRELLDQVALPHSIADRRPNELSGGQRQRIAIARALALRPDLIVCDEPVSALDVLVQEQILDLLAEIQRELDLAFLFISHDLAVVKAMAHEVVVMQLGRVIERGGVQEIFERPRGDYTRSLLEAVPGRALYQQLSPINVAPTPAPERKVTP